MEGRWQEGNLLAGGLANWARDYLYRICIPRKPGKDYSLSLAPYPPNRVVIGVWNLVAGKQDGWTRI